MCILAVVAGIVAAGLVGDLRQKDLTASGAGNVTSTAAEPSPATTTPEPIRVSIISAILHPAGLPSGQRRRRGRLSVHLKLTNGGTQRVVLTPPSVLAARQRIPTNARAVGPQGPLASIDAGMTVDVTLRFETAGSVTEQLATQKRARILVGARSWPITVKVGNPATSRARSRAMVRRALRMRTG